MAEVRSRNSNLPCLLILLDSRPQEILVKTKKDKIDFLRRVDKMICPVLQKFDNRKLACS